MKLGAALRCAAVASTLTLGNSNAAPDIKPPAGHGAEVQLRLSASRPPRPLQRIAIPTLKSWNTLRITLSRSMCEGTCPDYSVEIAGDGTVRYDGHEFVAVKGKHKASIDPRAVRGLVEAFKRADFYWLFDDYRNAGITDYPTYKISIAFDGQSKTVTDYIGRQVGMPGDVTDLENQIDAVAGTERWIKRRSRR